MSARNALDLKVKYFCFLFFKRKFHNMKWNERRREKNSFFLWFVFFFNFALFGIRKSAIASYIQKLRFIETI